MRILFADDELHNIAALIEKAEAEGHEVLTCMSATEAVTLASDGDVDLVVMDIMMDPGPDFPSVSPHQAGLAAIDRILELNRDQKIVCLSVIGDQAIINALKRKRVLFLRKGETPFRTSWKTLMAKATGTYEV